MTDSRPVSFAKALRLMAWLAYRRQVNRMQSARLVRKKAAAGGPTPRTGTGTKSGGRGIYTIFIFAILLFSGFNLGLQGISRLAATVGNIQQSTGKIVVSRYTYDALEKADVALRDARTGRSMTQRHGKRIRPAWDHYLDEILQYQVRSESLSDDDEPIRLKFLHETFDQKGVAAFAVNTSSDLLANGETWPQAAANSQIFLNALSLLLLLVVPMLICLWLGMNNKDLGQVEWSFEWLYNFPMSTRALLASRLYIYSLFNPPLWFFICPFLIIIFYVGGSGLNCVPLGLLTTLYLSVIAGALTMFLEVVLRKFLNLGTLKNLQALFTVVGTIAMLLYFASLISKPLQDFLVNQGRVLPPAFAWNPLSCMLLLAVPHQDPQIVWQVAGEMAAVVLLCAAASLLGAEYLVREGLLKAGGPYQGVRRKQADKSGSGWLRGVAANEMILLRRDRNLMVQVLITPLIGLGYYFLVNSNLVSSATANFHHAATMAFVIGAYVLMSSAMPVLSRENKTLWQLMTFPRGLESILFEKTIVWAAFALLYAGTTLILFVHFSRHLHASAWLDAFLALYGVALYAFIAAGIGIMGTDPLETEVRARFRTDMVYLYLVLVAMFATSIYLPSVWGKFAQLVLSTLLAYALWQKVKDISPYLLDPLEKPVRALSLADGMLAALAFFVLQGLLGFFLMQFKDVPLAMQVVLAYVIAGFLVFVLCIVTFTSQKVPHLWRSLGLAGPDGGIPPILPSILIGLAYGGAAAIGVMIYLHVADLVPQWQVWKQDAQIRSLFSSEGNPLWICLLAVVAAPLFEEFIFRGLVFQGLRRSTGPFWAVIASAALFALVHPPFSVIPVFGLGIAAAVSFQRSGFLLAPIVAHATYNAFVIFLNH